MSKTGDTGRQSVKARSTGSARQAVKSARRRLAGRHLARRSAGVVLLGIGIVGLLMPILPGWLLIFVGLALLGVRIPFVERMRERARNRIKRSPQV
jgi:hypothetical protein